MNCTITADFGTAEGETCRRNGCDGVLVTRMPNEGSCSCHINPPCSYCTSSTIACTKCDWAACNDIVINDYVVNVNKQTGVYRSWAPRPLAIDRVDWHNQIHTNSSMCKVGVYPPGTTKEEVRKLVDGTFGGRFEYFDGGKFKFIAYTD
jgi:hypothetical protein